MTRAWNKERVTMSKKKNGQKRRSAVQSKQKEINLMLLGILEGSLGFMERLTTRVEKLEAAGAHRRR